MPEHSTGDLGASWWREGVLYQIYPRSFQDSNGDGIGDLRGITSRLDHLGGRPDSLGVDGIWLSPFYPSPMADFGYDVSDYCDVDPAYGTLADFDELVREAHARGIRVIVDLVPNHTSDRHAWFQESRASRTSAKRDWYVWADPKPDGSPPNNWTSAFTRRQESVWTFDDATGQYYMHSFLPEQPDLNWWNPDVRAAFDGILRFWLDRDVDGFRIDVAHRMARDPELRDNPDFGLPPGEIVRFWTDEHPPRDQDWPEVHEILRGFRRTIDAYDARMAIGEVFILDPARLVRYYGEHDDELHMAFNFSFLRAPWSADAFRREVEIFERLLPASAWPDYALSNHDNPRAISRYAVPGNRGRTEARARLAGLMLLTLRGTPFLYYGEEIGQPDGEIRADRVVDVADRDPERTPMQWDGSASGGFTSGAAWLPVGSSAGTVNVAVQRDDPRSIFSFYRQLLRIRKSSPALRRGTYATLPGLPDDVLGYVREADADRQIVLLNFGEGDETIDLRRIAPGHRVRLWTRPDDPPTAAPPSGLVLGPDEGLLIEASER
ncbi:MAG TPA: alpha-amylase family glycosyl hydrolase [Candidatus Limnocylindrales bacterium]|nr:alpha-amylase family glycosyl hydrolase [Candidatus Limnocylindrales bacterium]